MGGVRIETVAKMAGVGKPTIYRSWSNAQEMTLAAVLAQANLDTKTVESDSPLDDLTEQLRSVIEVFSTVHGRQIAQMMAAAEQDSEIAKAFRSQIILKSREDGRMLLQKAILAKQIKRLDDMDVVLDMIYGPIFYRLLNHHAPLDSHLAEQIIANLRFEPGSGEGSNGRR